jgi:hypothetical protein
MMFEPTFHLWAYLALSLPEENGKMFHEDGGSYWELPCDVK